VENVSALEKARVVDYTFGGKYLRGRGRHHSRVVHSAASILASWNKLKFHVTKDVLPLLNRLSTSD
jgi:hypothetical protein